MSTVVILDFCFVVLRQMVLKMTFKLLYGVKTVYKIKRLQIQQKFQNEI